jgi:photosystem II stability/assembly factor-like uncharacterized protein
MIGNYLPVRVAVLAVCASAPAGAATVGVLVQGTAHQALFSVAVEGNAAVAVGSAGAIFESSDGGAQWHSVAAPPGTLSMLGVALNHGHAIAVGQLGAVLLRDHAGAWRSVRSGTTERLFAAALNSHGAGIAVGAFGTALATADWGATWHAIAPDWGGYTKDGEQPHLYDATIDDAGVMTMAGEFGFILRSADGKTWKTLHHGDASIFALDLRADGGGYAVGQNGTILRTADGGATWQSVDAGTKANLLGVRSTRDGHVAVSGMHDMVTSGDGGGTWSRPPAPRFAAAWYQGIADAGDGRPWLVAGHGGELLSITK